MQNYKKLYFDLFNAITSAVETLQAAQTEAEAEHILEESTKPGTKIFSLYKKESDKTTEE